MLGYALELCDAEFGLLIEYDAVAGCRAAYSRGIPEPFQTWFSEQGTFHVSPQTALGRVIATREVVNIADVRSEAIDLGGDPPSDMPPSNSAVRGLSRRFQCWPAIA